MMNCVREYLESGIIKPERINLNKSKTMTETSKNFTEFADSWFETNTWLNKKEMELKYTDLYSEEVTPHRFRKWIDNYADANDLKLDTKSSNSSNLFILKTEAESTRK